MEWREKFKDPKDPYDIDKIKLREAVLELDLRIRKLENDSGERNKVYAEMVRSGAKKKSGKQGVE